MTLCWLIRIPFSKDEQNWVPQLDLAENWTLPRSTGALLLFWSTFGRCQTLTGSTMCNKFAWQTLCCGDRAGVQEMESYRPYHSRVLILFTLNFAELWGCKSDYIYCKSMSITYNFRNHTCTGNNEKGFTVVNSSQLPSSNSFAFNPNVCTTT